ncbi:MAG TPA: 3-dehydroquinate synthase [Rhodothermales bacterium]|nr:3-dehydroquinate synthase [Rhodothermales bacterium]
MSLTIPHATGHYAVVTAPLVTLGSHLAATGLRPAPSLVVADAIVDGLHGEHLRTVLEQAGFAPRVLTFPAGESSKSLSVLSTLYDEALEAWPGRHTPVFAFGGGVAGDLSGFFAATLLRGLPLVHVPTTLLAMVDSSLGGKTGINHARGKNLIGSIYPPRLVLADPALLSTLPERQFVAGLAEAIKHALIADAGFFVWFEVHLDEVLARFELRVSEAVARAQAIKARFVADDEFEHGVRALLNFGHTFGHAFEVAAGYGTLLHGEAVAHGMKAALHLSQARTPTLPGARLRGLVERLPVAPIPALSRADVLDAMQLDKKRGARGVRFVLLDAVGHAYVADDVAEVEVEAALASVGIGA